MPTNGEGRKGVDDTANDQPTHDIEAALQSIEALSPKRREHFYALVREASEIELSDEQVKKIAAILWADRGAGAIASLQAGYRLFDSGLDETQKPRRRRRRTIGSLSAEERQHLLAALLSQRHVPPQPEAQNE